MYMYMNNDYCIWWPSPNNQRMGDHSIGQWWKGSWANKKFNYLRRTPILPLQSLWLNVVVNFMWGGGVVVYSSFPFPYRGLYCKLWPQCRKGAQLSTQRPTSWDYHRRKHYAMLIDIHVHATIISQQYHAWGLQYYTLSWHDRNQETTSWTTVGGSTMLVTTINPQYFHDYKLSLLAEMRT